MSYTVKVPFMSITLKLVLAQFKDIIRGRHFNKYWQSIES